MPHDPRRSPAIAASAHQHAGVADSYRISVQPRVRSALCQRAVVLLRRADGHRVKRILLVATTTGYQIRSFGEAAEALGVRLVFASDRCDRLEDPWWDQAIPVRFHEEATFRGRRARGVRGVTRLTGLWRSATGRRSWPRNSLAHSGCLVIHPRPPRSVETSWRPGEPFQSAGLPTPEFLVGTGGRGSRHPRVAHPLSSRPQAAGAVGKPRRGSGQYDRGARRRHAIGCADCCGARCSHRTRRGAWSTCSLSRSFRESNTPSKGC